ncbi:glycosyltransferase [Carboxydochorda subterranea]|uniref:Glycosyltransferase n=1 Tax=Carboxydichorda subterranea TaxID=3109565 RepID=A0ABZ1C1G5_9FIRM|nr:glycosyltransferase [Limnochorda sp. L945t]WRP18939.1 glycosyltransferase [Limnochorda sp. L945t]
MPPKAGTRSRLRVLLVWHGAAGGAHRRRFEALVRAGAELTVAVPSRWHENGRVVKTTGFEGDGYRVVPLKVVWPKHGALYLYTGSLARLWKAVRPQVVHVHEEPFSLSAAQALALAGLLRPRAAMVFEAWQNLYKRYPPPFSWVERRVLSRADHLIAGTSEIQDVLVRKGAKVPISVVPLGTSMDDFRRVDDPAIRATVRGGASFVIGYVGRLVPEKGVATLLKAAALLEGAWHVVVIGQGPERPALEELARQLGIHHRVSFLGALGHSDLPGYLSAMDVLVLPSLTTPRWKEQFGRVLIEAMACGVPAVGSSSGEIPRVVGDAGLVFREGDSNDLARCLRLLQSDSMLSAQLGMSGVDRVAKHFTWERVAAQTMDVYRQAYARRGLANHHELPEEIASRAVEMQ